MRTIPIALVKKADAVALDISALNISIDPALNLFSDIYFLGDEKSYSRSLLRVNQDIYKFYGRFRFSDATVSFFSFLKCVVL